MNSAFTHFLDLHIDLTREERKELAHRFGPDKDPSGEDVELMLRSSAAFIVHRVQFRTANVPERVRDDVLQDVVLHLFVVAKRFDPSRAESYLTWFHRLIDVAVRESMANYFSRTVTGFPKSWVGRLSSLRKIDPGWKDSHESAVAAVQKLMGHQRRETAEENAELFLRYGSSWRRDAGRWSYDGEQVLASVEDKCRGSVSEDVLRQENARRCVVQALWRMRKLDDRRIVQVMRRRLKGHTLQEIADDLNRTKQRVAQIEAKGKRLLRSCIVLDHELLSIAG